MTMLIAGVSPAGMPQALLAGDASLPWPNGSLISAQVLSRDGPDRATIMLGAYRMQAKVPPNTPIGHLWLELIDRELPARMRILDDARALQWLIRKIADLAQASRSIATTAQPKASSHAAQPGGNGWPPPESLPLPFSFHVSRDQQRLLLEQGDDEAPRAVMRKQIETDRYALHGRVDMRHLGALFFMLAQQTGGPMRLKLRAATQESFLILRQPFARFLADHNKAMRTSITGSLSLGDQPFLATDACEDALA